MGLDRLLMWLCMSLVASSSIRSKFLRMVVSGTGGLRPTAEEKLQAFR